ncbi:MAG: hypothetical protein M1840_002125 [Geoglossum simile]|nr:MAG: hypothetical protein M1840_002125 [Geoglossum simile]
MAPPADIKRFGVTEAYSSDNPEVDIVFIHGLMGEPSKTWTAKDSNVFWPTDLLPNDLLKKKLNARILLYGYNAEVFDFSGKTSSDKIHNHAQTLVSSLYANRSLEDAVERPLVFVCHSLGGIVLKRALQHSRSVVDKRIAHLRSIYISTYGILFLGTPHTGADPAKWASLLLNLAHATIFSNRVPEPSIVRALQSNSETLQNINLEFVNFQKRFSLFFFHETLQTKKVGDYIVDKVSAAPLVEGAEYAGIEADHRGMCKFETKNSSGYDLVVAAIQRYSSKEIVGMIQGRWQDDRRRLQQDAALEANEMVSTYNNGNASAFRHSPHMGSVASAPFNPHDVPTPTPSHRPSPNLNHDEPLFVVPPDFSRNTIFVGMDTELRELNRLLFDVNVRAQGTACVLLWCLAGGGKTHLAREYVYRERQSFPGGVFWVTVKSHEELIDGFWRIAQKAALKGLRDPRGPRGLPSQREIDAFIEPVREWFESREDWLLVFDGIPAESDDDLSDLRRCIPNHPNSSIIYTSVDRTLARKHLLLSPAALKVEQLKALEAQDLLFRELPTLNRQDQADRSNATELVQKMQYLPLMIHAAARFLNTTYLPLRSYLRSYPKSRIENLEPYQRIFEALTMNFIEATNLISILCFFSQHIPVEMLQLGIGIMDQADHSVMMREGGRPDLNITIGVLIKYALVDRNGLDDSECSSPNHQEHQHDTLKLHSVVQDFAREFLREAKYEWLKLAIMVFCHSYNEADSRIRGKSGVGRVSDYHQYKIHGQRLSKYVHHYEKDHGYLDDTRFELESTMKSIKLEIQKRTPRLSQELVNGPDGEPFQISIFDRTSSASDMSLGSSRKVSTDVQWSDKTHVESPVGIVPDTSLPPAIAYGSSPRIQRFPPEDRGYDTDRDEPGRSTHSPSAGSQTPRPDTALDQGGVWHLVTGKKAQANKPAGGRPTPHRTISALNQRRYRDQKGAWRNIAPTSPVDPRVIKATAEGSMAPRPAFARMGSVTGNSAAQIALSMAFQKASPPGSSQGGKTVGQQLSSNHSIATTASPTLSYAAAAAARSPPLGMQRGPSGPSGAGSAGGSAAMVRDRSNGSTPSRGPDHLSLMGSSSSNRLITQSVPPQSAGLPLPPFSAGLRPSQMPSPTLHYENVAHHSDPTLPGLGGYGYVESFGQPRPFGRNPRPIPYEQITVPTKRRHDERYSSSSYTPPFPGLSYGYPGAALGFGANDVNLNGNLLTGYTSQPLSRHVSQQSADTTQSVIDSEPARLPPILSPPVYPRRLNPPSERDRHVDGAPVRKSPKYALLDQGNGNDNNNNNSNSISPIATHAPDHPFHDPTLSQMGGWADSPATRPSHLSYHPNGPGLGIDLTGHYVQFGDAATIDLHAKQAELRRAAEHQRFANGYYRQYLLHPPYPYLNLMPSSPDSRSRGLSAPGQPPELDAYFATRPGTEIPAELLEGGLEMRRSGSRRPGGEGGGGGSG